MPRQVRSRPGRGWSDDVSGCRTADALAPLRAPRRRHSPRCGSRSASSPRPRAPRPMSAEPGGLLGAAGSVVGGVTEVTGASATRSATSSTRSQLPVGQVAPAGRRRGTRARRRLPFPRSSTPPRMPRTARSRARTSSVGTVVNELTGTLSDVAGGGTVGGVTAPVTGPLDGVVGSVPIVGDLLGDDAVGGVVAPVAGPRRRHARCGRRLDGRTAHRRHRPPAAASRDPARSRRLRDSAARRSPAAPGGLDEPCRRGGRSARVRWHPRSDRAPRGSTPRRRSPADHARGWRHAARRRPPRVPGSPGRAHRRRRLGWSRLGRRRGIRNLRRGLRRARPRRARVAGAARGRRRTPVVAGVRHRHHP